MNIPASIGLYRCRYSLAGGEWKIADIQSQPRFRH
jgi:hypothetical protein